MEPTDADMMGLLVQLRMQSADLMLQVACLHDHIGDRLVGLVRERRTALGQPDRLW